MFCKSEIAISSKTSNRFCSGSGLKLNRWNPVEKFPITWEPFDFRWSESFPAWFFIHFLSEVKWQIATSDVNHHWWWFTAAKDLVPWPKFGLPWRWMNSNGFHGNRVGHQVKSPWITWHLIQSPLNLTGFESDPLAPKGMHLWSRSGHHQFSRWLRRGPLTSKHKYCTDFFCTRGREGGGSKTTGWTAITNLIHHLYPQNRDRVVNRTCSGSRHRRECHPEWTPRDVIS